jgi:RND family efflux transporter MFP subunit
MRSRNTHLLAVLAILAALAAGPGCGRKAADAGPNPAARGDSAAAGAAEAGENGEGDEGEKTPRERVTTVDAARAARADLVVPVVAEGTVRARRTAEIRPEVAGRIAEISVVEGQRIRKNQLIMRLDDREHAVALAEARSAYLESLSRLAAEEGLIASGADTSMSALEALALEGGFRRDVAAARSGVAAARARLERARLNLEHTELVAPFDGVISGLRLAPGQQVSIGQTLCTLVDDVSIEAEVGVLEADLKGVGVGRPALLAVPALDETLRVQVDVLSPEVDRESRTCRVLMRFRSEDGRIKPGMFVRAAIAGETHRDRLLVPREAILTRDARPLVFKIEDDRAKWLYVELGDRNDRLVEIKQVTRGGDLAPGDLVVVSDHLTLTHDAKVKVRRTVEPTDPWATGE